MEDKILYWLDRSFIYFGIAKSLQEKYPCKLYGIADIDKTAKEFLQEQQLVKFQKIWYFQNNIQDKEKNIDLEYLRNFETKYKINLWKIAFGDRHLLKDTNRYHKFTRNEILLIFEQECKFFEKILDEVKPQFLIIFTTTDHHDMLLYEMCKKLRIRVLMLRTSRMGYRLIISEDIDKIDKEDIKNNKNYSENNTLDKINEYIKKYSALKQVDRLKNKYNVPKLEKIKALQSFLITGNESNKQYFNYGKTRFKIITKGSGLFHMLRKKYLKSFMDANFLKELDDTKFIYFPLHKEPERFLNVGAPYFVDQKQIVKYVAKSIPVGYKLYTRDHPAMLKTTLWRRSTSFYQEILDLPNVRIIHPDLPSDEIFKKCSLVISINGSSALEAAINNKPSILFTDTDFSKISSITLVDQLENLPNSIKSALDKKVKPKEISKFMDILDKNSFEEDFVDLHVDFQSMFYYPGFLKLPKYSSSKINEYIEKHKNAFENIANEYIKKLTLIKNSEI